MNILELTGAESCKECGERAQAERDRLQTENAKLVMKLNAEHIVRQNVERENAKLRELVRDMFYAVHPVDREKFLTNVVELGVGVDA